MQFVSAVRWYNPAEPIYFKIDPQLDTVRVFAEYKVSAIVYLTRMLTAKNPNFQLINERLIGSRPCGKPW